MKVAPPIISALQYVLFWTGTSFSNCIAPAASSEQLFHPGIIPVLTLLVLPPFLRFCKTSFNSASILSFEWIVDS